MWLGSDLTDRLHTYAEGGSRDKVSREPACAMLDTQQHQTMVGAARNEGNQDDPDR